MQYFWIATKNKLTCDTFLFGFAFRLDTKEYIDVGQRELSDYTLFDQEIYRLHMHTFLMSRLMLYQICVYETELFGRLVSKRC